jgi:hypothetical protein
MWCFPGAFSRGDMLVFVSRVFEVKQAMTSEASSEQTMSSSGYRFLIAGAIFFSVLIFYAWDYVDGLSYFRAVQQWPVTEGIIIRNTLAPVIPRDQPNALEKTFAAPAEEKGILYTYNVNGHEFSSACLVLTQPRKFLQNLKMFYDRPDEKLLGTKYPVGTTVEVHYNSQNPNEACLDVSAGWKSRYIATCFSALVIILPTIGFLLASLFIYKSESQSITKRT